MVVVPVSVSAQGRGARVLRAIEIRSTSTGWELELRLDFPVRYLSHLPPTGSAKLLRIQVDPLDVGNRDRGLDRIREILPLPKDRTVPLVEVAYDASLRPRSIDLQFSRSMSFQVQLEEGFRSLRIRVDEVAPIRADAEPETGEQTKARQMFIRAKRAIRDGELDLAIALLTKILDLPADDVSPEVRQQAQELLGLTHERRGQTAHARADYEAYLEAYPDGPAAERVAQRLQALVTAGAAPQPALREPTDRARSTLAASKSAPLEFDVFGSFAVRYFRSESMFGKEIDEFLATNILADADLAGRIDAEDWLVRTDFAGDYDIDLEDDGRSNDLRISRLAAEYEDRLRGIEVTLGRQRRSDSGVLGRFDGIRASSRLGPHYAVAALVGLPVESTSDKKPNMDTIMAGAAFNVDDLWLEGLRGQLFVIGQNTESMQDRTAIGGEVRYSSPKSYSFVYLDYDALFNSLNTAIVSSNYFWTPETDFRVLLERRNSPVLTLASALQGQGLGGLDDLKEITSNSEIRDLALDRIVVLWTSTFGATHRPTDRLQISGDFTIFYSEGTSSSNIVNDPGEVIEGMDASGPDFSASIQFNFSDWLVEGDVGSFSMRYFEGDTSRSFITSAFSRFVLPAGFRIRPRARFDWRQTDAFGDTLLFRPSLETDWRYRSILLNANAGFQWLQPVAGSELDRELSYFVELGVRLEF